MLKKEAAGSWDWRELIQRLANPLIHEPGDTSIDLPLGLKNRRRIWRLLEEARVHDVAGKEEARWAAEERGEEYGKVLGRASRMAHDQDPTSRWPPKPTPPVGANATKDQGE